MNPNAPGRRARGRLLRFIACSVPSLLLAHIAAPTALSAQGDGPRTFIPRPVGIQSVVPFYIHLDSNLNIENSVVLDGANLSVHIGGVGYRNVFAIGDRLVQVLANLSWGTLSGTVEPGGPFAFLPELRVPKSSGLLDPTVALRVSLFGARTLRMPEFAKVPPRFEGSAILVVSPPLGKYDSDLLFNVGSNRWLIRFGVPLVVPIGDPRTLTFLEFVPGVIMFTDNTNPPGEAELLEQSAMYAIEAHLSRNFTRSLWSSVDMRMHRGGATKTDGVSNDDPVGQVAAGMTVGYMFAAHLGADASYGRIVFRNDDSKGWMFRTRMVFAW